jgi:hypothetical protein
MATISIEGGTTYLGNNVYRYQYGTVDGIVSIDFTASQKPKVGDMIVDGVFVPLLEWKINDDKSRWICHDEETWPIKMVV